jgi:hypothetical protein
MKKTLLLFLGAVLIGGGVYAYLYPEKITELRDRLSQSQLVEDIIAFERVIAPPPLRFPGGNAGVLSHAGVISETNRRRTAFNQTVLTENEELNEAARRKLEDMAAKQYFEHVSPDGKGPSDLADEAGYSYVVIGENLALGNFANDAELLDAWMNSPGHRANILNEKFSEIGVAVAKKEFQGKMTWLAVQEFGKPSSSCPKLDQNIKAEIDGSKRELDIKEKDLNNRKQQLENTRPQGREEIDAYNRAIAEYNGLVESYKRDVATLRELINTYNLQVRAYNSCLSS